MLHLLCSLFVNSKVLLSQKGTSRGYTLAMAEFWIVRLPLERLLENTDIVLKFADDGNAVEKLRYVHRQHEALAGYLITKSHLIAKKITLKKLRKKSRNKKVDFSEGHRELEHFISGANQKSARST